MGSKQGSPQELGGFEVLGLIDQTPLVNRYAARTLREGPIARQVWLEVLKPQWQADSILRATFLEEAHASLNSPHPNRPKAMQVLNEEKQCILVLESIEGQSLLTLWERMNSERITLPLRLHILHQLLVALSDLPSTGSADTDACHGDMGPHNVWLAQHGGIYLRGLGFSRCLSLVTERLAASNSVLSFNRGYAAPEQVLGACASAQTDIYAIGVMLWEAVAGQRRIFHRETEAILSQRMAGTEPNIESLVPHASGRLVVQCRQALALDPHRRYENLVDFREDLMGFLEDVYGEDRGAQKQELISLLHKGATSLPSRVATQTHKVPNSEPDTAAHAVFSENLPKQAPSAKVTKLAIVGLVVLLGFAVLSVRRLRQHTAVSQALVPAAQPALTSTPIPESPDKAPATLTLRPADSPLPLNQEAVLTEIIDPERALAEPKLPTLKLEQLKLVPPLLSDRRARRPRSRWRRKRGQKLRPIDETDPYAE